MSSTRTFSVCEGRPALARLSAASSPLRGARIVLTVVGDCIEGCAMVSEVQAMFGGVDLSLNPEDDRLIALKPMILGRSGNSLLGLDDTG